MDNVFCSNVESFDWRLCFTLLVSSRTFQLGKSFVLCVKLTLSNEETYFGKIKPFEQHRKNVYTNRFSLPLE